MNDNKKNLIDKNIEILVASDPNKISPTALKTAAEEIVKETEVRAVANAKQLLKIADGNVASAVNELRGIRDAERRAKAYLVNLVAARDEFVKTGNWEAYAEAARNRTSL